MENGATWLDDIAKLSSEIMVATEAMLPFERAATKQLRAEVLAIQLDTEVMKGLLSRLKEKCNTTSKGSKEQEAAFADASEKFIQTMRTILSDQGLGQVANNLRNTPKDQHFPITTSIYAASRDVRASRHTFDAAFKAYWLPRFITTGLPAISHDLLTKEYPEQVRNLLLAFRERPFAVGSTDDPFIKAVPGRRSDIPTYATYQHRVAESGIAWTRAYGGDTRSLEALQATQNAVFSLAWGGTLETIAKIDIKVFEQPRVDFSEMALAQTELSNKLRDSIQRQYSPRFSIVFVGAESSGKSTFLNAFIGTEMLPTGEGPTTSYPVRIRHISGQVIPVMTLGVRTLQDSLGKLQRGHWLERVATLMGDIKATRWGDDADWKGTDLPIGFDFERFKLRWAGLGERTVERLRELTTTDLKFVEEVTGAENILNTLRDLNDFVRICRSLPIGFDHFAPEEWPIISVEFSNLRDAYDGPVLEGIGGSNTDYQWDEMIQQTIRSAKSVVAVVSLRQFASQEWEELPHFIAKGTNVRATSVIATMRDRGPLGPAELQSRLRYIEATFWPYSSTNRAKGKIFLCSTPLGTSMQAMKKFLEDQEALPDWDALWAPSLTKASEKLFPGKLRHTYAKFTLGSLRKLTGDLLQSSGLSETMRAMVDIINTGRKESILEESKSVIFQLKRIAFDIRRMLAAVGKALGDVENPSSDDRMLASSAAIEQLDLWDSRSEEFSDTVQTIVSSALDDLAKETEINVADAMLEVWRDLRQEMSTVSLPDSFDFKYFDDIQRYMRAYQEFMRKVLLAKEDSKSQNVLEELEKIHEKMFSELRVKATETEPSIAKSWPGPLKQDFPSSNLPLFSADVLQKHVQEQRVRYSVSEAFEAVERRILRLFPSKESPGDRLNTTQTHYKWLLAVAATLPFILILPYWLRQTYIESYRIRVDSVRAHLLSSANAHSSDTLGQAGDRAITHVQAESAFAARAISALFLVPDGYSTVGALPHATPGELQLVTAAAANLSALNAAIGWIQSSVEQTG